MTEGNPDGPTGPGKAPTAVPPTLPKPERPGRSNEFYLALAGIAATVVVGLVGGLLTYQTSKNQMTAETQRSALSFSREQRKVAYVEFLNALFDLDRAELNIRDANDASLANGGGSKLLEEQYTVYTEATDDLNRAVAAVRLLASPDVAAARDAIRDNHSAIFFQITTLMAAAKRGAPPSVLDALRAKVGTAAPELEERFIDAAKKDLGVTR